MLDGRSAGSAAAVGGWRAPDSPNDLQEAFANTKHASGKPSKKDSTSKGSGKKASDTALPALGAAANTRGKRATGSVASSVSHRSSTAKGGKKKGSASSTRSRGAAASTGSKQKKSAAAKKKGSVSKTKSGARSSVASSSRRSATSSKGAKTKKTATAAKGKKRAAGAGSAAASTKGAKKPRGSKSSVASSTGSRGRKSITGAGAKAGKKKKQLTLVVALSHIEEEEAEMRRALLAEEELERGGYHPIYNVLVMEIVRTQIQQLNARQQLLNQTFQSLRAEGFPVGEGDEAAMESMLERLRQKLQSDAQEEVQRLREENTSLRERLEDRSLEVEKKVAELEVLRNSMARKLARTEVDNEHIRAEAQSVLQNATIDVERMKKELGYRLDIATASLRTPKYGSALRSLQDLAAEVQDEIQEHRDRLSKLIASIGSRDTFRKDPSDTMHSNFPAQYRAQLRTLERDHLINVLDVLSFQEGVVDTVGKALYVLSETEHKTAVV